MCGDIVAFPPRGHGEIIRSIDQDPVPSALMKQVLDQPDAGFE
jgi:hypothetical protein